MKYFNIVALLLSVSVVSAYNDYNGGKEPYKQEKPCDDKTVTKTVCVTKTLSACPNPIPTDPTKNLKTLPYERPKDMIYRKHGNKPSKNEVRKESGKKQQAQELHMKNPKHKSKYPLKEDRIIVDEHQYNNRKNKSNKGLRYKPIDRRPRKQHNEEE
ncbi:hypothetical protein K502DRAFT_355525 [Neoconidiobolus thromboides FSU 785]|nr:hypothetical protein K502DRAFT_355525 [Neoconidiobolus thromboides FSU 785]